MIRVLKIISFVFIFFICFLYFKNEIYSLWIKTLYGKEPFSSEKWNTGVDRKEMVYDLIANHHLCDKDEFQIKQMLGDVEDYHFTEQYYPWVLDDHKSLILDMNFNRGKGYRDKVNAIFIIRKNAMIAPFRIDCRSTAMR